MRLLQYAKATGVPVFLVGHVTKAGDLAGPRLLEHLVDTVLYMEGEEASSLGGGSSAGSGGGLSASSSAASGSGASHRLVRAVKNRFGSTSEVGLFEMTEVGFVESNPALLFLSKAPSDAKDAGAADDDVNGSGCAVGVSMEGTRPLCVELQVWPTV